jgi:hypothetical protein
MAATRPAPVTGALDQSQARRWFDIAVVVAALWFFGGLLLDGWAHNNLDLSHEGFFTPYHAVFYSGFVALASVLFVATWRNRSPGMTWREAIPAGYGGMALGMAIFATGGALDMVWHLAFGIEQDWAALFSPTHLLLATGGAIMMSGAISAGLGRPNQRSWAAQWPTLLPLSLFATLVMFFFMWAFETGAARAADPRLLYPHLAPNVLADVRDLRVTSGVAAIVVRSLIIVGFVGWAARRMALPFGSVTLLVAVPNVLIATMLDPTARSIGLSAIGSLAAGLAGDVALARYVDMRVASWRSRLFGFALPFVFWAVLMALAYAVTGGFWWSPHVAFGAPVIAGLCGLLLTLASEPATQRS